LVGLGAWDRHADTRDAGVDDDRIFFGEPGVARGEAERRVEALEIPPPLGAGKVDSCAFTLCGMTDLAGASGDRVEVHGRRRGHPQSDEIPPHRMSSTGWFEVVFRI